MPPTRLLGMIVRNLRRSKTRSFATIAGCAIGAFVICFFLSAENSLNQMLDVKGSEANLIIKQKDRY